jgi:hypothetical protein
LSGRGTLVGGPQQHVVDRDALRGRQAGELIRGNTTEQVSECRVGKRTFALSDPRGQYPESAFTSLLECR